ncbi:MAG TPA: CARDB domain-containing protein, partial [Anaerolineales bacterium]|nr:CARDB domain-containing protein [Anaerolineales bacterium]
MRLRTFFQFLVIVSLSACTPIVLSPTAIPPSPTINLPDLVISSVYLGMQGIPGNSGNCVPAYAPYEIRAIIENRGLAPAANIAVVEQNTGQRSDIGSLQPSQSIEIIIPLDSTSGTYTVVVDPQNVVTESDENNNVYSYLAPTPTPPVICPPTQPTPIPTLPPVTPSPLSLEGLFYADMNSAAIMKAFAYGQPAQVLQGTMAQFSPDGLQALFERS